MTVFSKANQTQKEISMGLSGEGLNVQGIMNRAKKAVVARINGEYDNRALMHFGPMGFLIDDIEHILSVTSLEVTKKNKKGDRKKHEVRKPFQNSQGKA